MTRPTLHRSARRLAVLVLAVVIAVAVPREAHAEFSSTLDEVERAYEEVDFERARSLASDALRAGGHGPAETRRLYTLLGISAAALGQDDVARRAFVRALLADPELKLDQSLSPKLRAPYLEARGRWASATSERGLDARLRLDGGSAVVGVFDPMNAVHSVELAYGPFGSKARSSRRYPRKSELRIPVTPADTYELRLLDEYGNALWEGTRRAAPVAAMPVRAPEPNRAPYYVVATTLGAAGLAGIAGGVVFQLERERLAREWNGASCEEPGASREEQCGDVDEERQRAELYSAGLYAIGGALLVGSIVTLAIVPGDPKERSDRRATLNCATTAGVFGLTCRGRF